MGEEKTVQFRKQRGRHKPKGRAVTAADRAALREIFGGDIDGGTSGGAPGGAGLDKDHLIENLHAIQDALGHLPAGVLAALAEAMKLPMAAVYEVATFYHHFDVVREGAAPPPPITVRVCESLSCEMAGARELLDDLRARYGDSVRVKPAPCVGRCAAAPVAVVGQNAIERADTAAVTAAVSGGQTAAAAPAAQGFADYVGGGGSGVWRVCVSGGRAAESVIAAIEESGLRGLGGAGFPAGRKWRIVREQAGEKILAVNIDEGEPGTFKDRYYLERAPHQFLEGMLIAAWVIGARRIYIYLRDEYHGCRAMLARELAALRDGAAGLLSDGAGGVLSGEATGLPAADFVMPQIFLRRGAGAYICGEESAMIESIEGKRGEPRLRPPYVAQVGVFGRPTLEHNMETLYWAPKILADGAAAFAAAGRRGRRGWRSFSVSGRVRNPGVHVAPAGVTARELIDEFCGGMAEGHEFYAYLPGGASGGILPATMDDVPLDFDTIQQADSDCFIGSAAVIILSRADRARDAALNMMRFFEDESCGQCAPCRVGTAKAAALMRSARWDAALLEELSRAMADASICGLGQAAPNPIRCVIKHFPREIA